MVMRWSLLITTILEEISISQYKLQRFIQKKLPARINNQIDELNNKKRLYYLLDKIISHFLIFLFIIFLSFILVLNSDFNNMLTSAITGIIIVTMVLLIKIDWNRKLEIKSMYIELTKYFDNVDFDPCNEELDDEVELFDTFVDKVEDIINIGEIILHFEKDDRINPHLKTSWYQIWSPSLIGFLNEFYGYPKAVVENRIEFQQKLFERVVLTGVIGFSFLIIRTLSIPDIYTIDISGIISTVITLVFIITLLLLVSYPVVRFPALKLELSYWIDEHELNLHSIKNHPPRLMDKNELSTPEMEMKSSN